MRKRKQRQHGTRETRETSAQFQKYCGIVLSIGAVGRSSEASRDGAKTRQELLRNPHEGNCAACL
jgi:hypothetical protein